MTGHSVRGATLDSLIDAARETLGEVTLDGILARGSDELRETVFDCDPSRWYPAERHVELLDLIDAASGGGSARAVSDRAIGRDLGGGLRALVPKLSPSCMAERFHALVAERSDVLRLDLVDRTLVSARWRTTMQLASAAAAEEEAQRMLASVSEWLLGAARGAWMASGAPDAKAVLSIRGGVGELRVDWA